MRQLAVLVSSALLALTVALAPTGALGAPAVDNAHSLYVLDGWGGIHPAGSSPAFAPSGYWSGWDIARGMSLFADGSGGYTVDGFGGLHPFGSAPVIPDASHAYWPGWDIVRGVALAPWATPAAPAGWILDGYGALWNFGSAPAIDHATHAYWSGWDIARGFAVFPDSAPGTVAGYLLDGFGGLHGFAAGGAAEPGHAQISGYWGGWDIAHSVAVLPGSSHQGYVLDGFGGLHAFAPAGTPMPAQFGAGAIAYWAGWDIARSVTMWTGSPPGKPGGWTIDGYGGVHSFGSAPYEPASAYWAGWDIARASAGAGSGSGGRGPVSRVLDVPEDGQVYNLSCEAAALQMVLASRGIAAGQGTILSVLGVDYRRPVWNAGGFHWGDPYANFVGNPSGSEPSLTGYGTYFSAIARVASQLGAGVRAANESYPPSAVYDDVLNGRPVIAWISYDYAPHAPVAYQAFDGRWVQFGVPYEHAVVVRGVTPGSVLVNDPARGTYWVSKVSFETAYAVFNHMAVVVN